MPDDTDKALAYRRYERTVCRQCATREADWFDENGDPLMPAPLEAVLHRCPGCAEMDRLRSFAQEEKLDMAGAYIALVPYDADRGPVMAGGD